MNKITYFINNKLNTTLLLFIIICLSTIKFKLSANEEFYLACAKKVYFSGWMPNSAVFDEFQGTRIIFQHLIGWLFHLVGFVQISIIGTFLTSIIFAVALEKLAKLFEIPNLVLILILLIWIPDQALFAGGWMIGSFETKVFSYFFSLLAICMYFENKFLQSIFLQIAAFYFHILVGGWISVVLFLGFTKKIKYKSIQFYFIYLIAVLPYCIYIIFGLFSDPFVSPDINLDWVYTYYRNPHHLTPFKSLEFFLSKYLLGVVISFSFYILHFIIIQKSNSQLIKDLAFLNISLFSIQIVFLIVAYFDSNGFFLKTYPFRCSVFYFLFSLIEFTIVLLSLYKTKSVNQFKTNLVSFLFISILLISGLRLYDKKIKNHLEKYDTSIFTLANFLKTTPHDTKIMFLCDDPNLIAIPRLSERDFFVFWKFVPTEKKLLYDWYHSVQIQKRIIDDLDILKTESIKENIDCIVTNFDIKNQFLELKFSNNLYKCYCYN